MAEYARQTPETPPPVQVRYFHASPIAIDDPLAEPSPPSAGRKLTPFSASDNALLEEAWHQLRRSKKPSITTPPPSSSEVIEPVSAIEVTDLSATTGTPFVRAPSAKRIWQPPKESPRNVNPEPIEEETPPEAKLPVGVSRLHQVHLPSLLMQPIYWTAVTPPAPVIRATWFYEDTLLPVEPRVANMLEAGYMDHQAWTQTWKDELDSAVEAGASGEMKITHKLWPDSVPKREASTETETEEQTRERAVQSACEFIDFTSDNEVDNKATGTLPGPENTYPTWGVIYSSPSSARLLKPSLMPSAYYGRRPLANYIRKGYKLGIAVMRGFSQSTYTKIYNPPTPPTPLPTTDLILVIHGIGQKLSKRVSSFNFTHAVDSFRRSIQREASLPSTQTHFRKGMGGITTLPINWRLSLPDEVESTTPFTLEEITPEGMPWVRNLVSDVMLDVPYYMSHHKEKMLAAVVGEVRRVYRLWCGNNMGFEEKGRVHLLGHSLGSVMALEILSGKWDLGFRTHNLFLVGSPVGFFLLLNRAVLRPRWNGREEGDLAAPRQEKGRESRSAETSASVSTPPSASASPQQDGIYGTSGEYGTLACWNVYNIVNGNDPIAYRVNAAVDAAYAGMIRPAVIPAAEEGGWFGRRGDGYGPVDHKIETVGVTPSERNVELETHDFSREATAEKRFFLLNENGQVDYFLREGGGVFSVLSAHGAYWANRDFVRFLVVETGRGGPLSALRVRKKGRG
ncbi:hypothetical protein K470DRAFT_275900 [Piedraia hortae CBS 480.64]|uniref:DDHD domain-containing protein n=1 Tax=Piedraia hortae CBS 480.64 TaxID=1314780 RepID=A0A6A7C3A6_9PEZI|nr:hypothetical protein K470DRAFT_275900 [Piedraia hortae CBS 480.64]